VAEITTIGLDIAKRVFHAHRQMPRGALFSGGGSSRGKPPEFFSGIITLTVEDLG
jgi:hypothetical protein